MNAILVHDALENNSQRYIEKLRINKQAADESMRQALSSKTASNTALREADEWKAVIDNYWTNVKATQGKYEETHKSIHRLMDFTNVISDNVHQAGEAVEVLACVLREMSKETDILQLKIGDLKKRLSTVTNKSSNAYYRLIEEFEAKVGDAIKTYEAAIRAVLELLKEIYLLDINLSGRVAVDRIRLQIEGLSLLEIGHKDWMEFHHIIDLPMIWRDRNYGVLENLVHLHRLLIKDMAYPLSDLSIVERESLPFPITEENDVPTFPLTKEAYYTSTETQFNAAKLKQEKAKANSEKADSNFVRAEARFKAAEDALKSAENAKNLTGGVVVSRN